MVAAAGGLDRPRPGGDEQRVVEELGSAPRRRGAEVGVHGGEVVDDEERTACVREPGEVEAVHAATIEAVYRQQLVPVEGQTDVLTMGLPYICPYNVNSVMNPILVMCLGLGYFFNLYRGRPLVREGGVVIMAHPTPWEFHPVHHPSYIDFFEQVLTETTDPAEIEAKFEEDFATDPWYIHLYRTSYAYHGVHPFYMWYWGAHALEHVGDVIFVGGDPKAVRRMGFKPASTLRDALEMAEDVVGRHPSITHMHAPPLLMSDVT